MLSPDRYFDPNPAVRDLARELYQRAERLPLVCPHGHVDPRILAEDTPFPDPAALLVIPDHYVTRMLYSQGVPLEALGVPSLDGSPVETDSRKIWRRFAEHMPLFRATPSGCNREPSSRCDLCGLLQPHLCDLDTATSGSSSGGP